MILANFMTELSIALGLLGAFVGLVFYLLIVGVGLLARHIHNDYRRQGGAKTVLKKVAARGAGELIKRAIKSRFQ